MAATAPPISSGKPTRPIAVTATTPLQFQKDLRLLAARQSLTGGTRSVTDVAYDVGFESPTQFSREYTRKFGVSPRADRAA